MVATINVILPVFNAGETLARQLSALAAQSFKDFELIVADNGSTDNSLAICRSFSTSMNMRIVDASLQRGAAFARNTAVATATAENLAFCDADDEAARDWLAGMVRALSDHVFVAGRIDCTVLNDASLYKTRPPLPGYKEYFDRRLASVPTSNLGIRRVLCEQVGGFDISIPRGTACEDDDFSVRVHLTGARPFFASDAVIYYGYQRRLLAIFRQGKSYGRGDLYMANRYRNLNYWRPDPPEWRKIITGSFRTKGDIGRRLWEFGEALGRSGY